MPLDQDTILRLIAQHGGALLAITRGLTNDGEDLVQEAFCKLVTEDPPPENPIAWLFQVVRNEVRQLHRTNSRRSKREKATAKLELEMHNLSSMIEQNEVQQALEKLPDELREIVIMRLWGELTLEEVADSCQISVSTAHRQYKKAIDQIRQMMSGVSKRAPT